MALQLYLLPSLVPPRGRTKQKLRTAWKPSISEARDSLMIHIKLPADLEEAKKKQIDFSYSKGLSLQPYILLVGPSLNNITSALVIINNYNYKCRSVIEAFDFCFKAYQIIDAEYPIASHHLWYLFQWKLYNYHNKKDPHFPYLNELL